VWRPVRYDWDSAEEAENDGTKAAVMAALAFSLLNPHVYLDTVVLIGGIAAQFEYVERIYFAIGAACASALWFYGTGYGATRIAPFFHTLAGQRLLDGTICVVMWSVAASLIVGVLEQ
jgi:L-lysine exporter family protein LysE/ArgO